MKSFTPTAIKCSFSWKAENPPKIDPSDPVLEVISSEIRVIARLSPKNAKKLAAHQGAGKIEGRLVLVNGRFELAESSVQLFDPPKPVSDRVSESSPVFANPPVGSPALKKLSDLVKARESKSNAAPVS